MARKPSSPTQSAPRSSAVTAHEAARWPLASGITAANYFERAKAFMQVRARHPDDFGVTLDRGVDKAEWAAWQSYFERKKIAYAYMSVAPTCQVPTYWPREFDEDETVPASTPAWRRDLELRDD